MNRPTYISEIKFTGELSHCGYLQEIPAIQHLAHTGSLPLSSPVTFFVGENGTGKSTLLEAIAVSYGLNPEGGTRNFRFSTKDTHSQLCEHLTLVKRDYAMDTFFLRAESFYNAATYMEELGLTRGNFIHSQSHGESFLSIVQTFRGQGLYLLDEPEAALSPSRLLTLLLELRNLTQHGAQFIIATHSPILMAFPGAQVLEFSHEGIHPVSYKDTENYKVTKQFLENPEKMLHYLFQ